MQRRTLIIILFALVIGFGAGFVLRPVIAPTGPVIVAAGPAPIKTTQSAARGVQYFVANLDEARRIVAGCEDGSVRGDECANAQQAVAEVDGRARFKKFMAR